MTGYILVINKKWLKKQAQNYDLEKVAAELWWIDSYMNSSWIILIPKTISDPSKPFQNQWSQHDDTHYSLHGLSVSLLKLGLCVTVTWANELRWLGCFHAIKKWKREKPLLPSDKAGKKMRTLILNSFFKRKKRERGNFEYN